MSNRQLPVVIELAMTAEWVGTVVIRSVVVTVTVLRLLVVKDEVELYTNVDEGLLELFVKCDDVPILLDDSLLLSVRDCEGDNEVDCVGDSKKDCEGDSEGDCEGDSEGDCEGDSKRDCEEDSEEVSEGDSERDCEKVGEGVGEEIGDSSVDEKRDYYISWSWGKILGTSNDICENTIHCTSGLTTIQIKVHVLSATLNHILLFI